MAVYAPGDDPPPPNVDPGMWARIMGFVGNLSPIGSANAAEMDPRQKALLDAQAQLAAGHPQNINQPPTFGPVAPIQRAAQIPPILPPAGPPPPAAPPRPGGIGSDANFPVMGAGGFPTTYAPPGQQPAMPTPVGARTAPTLASAPLPPPRPANLGGVIPANARGEVAAPPAQSPWITTEYSRPNMEPGLRGGMLGGMLASPRGTGGPSPMGMLDLSGLFGGGAAPPVAQPKTRINVGKIPANARAEVPPDTTSKAPWGYGPKQKPKAADVARARILRPDYYG